MTSAKQYLNVLAGAWLFTSAFLWPHGQAQFTNTCATGLLCAVTAALAGSAPRFRFLNTAIGVWLFITAFSIPALTAATVWNNALVAMAIFVVSLLPPTRAGGRPRPRFAHAVR
jgi:hypothetical protein